VRESQREKQKECHICETLEKRDVMDVGSTMLARETERERERECVCVKRERERESVCVCVTVR